MQCSVEGAENHPDDIVSLPYLTHILNCGYFLNYYFFHPLLVA
jgi:hypothetical protein